MSDRVEKLREFIRDVPNFPKPGIMFKDITPLLANPTAFNTVLDLMSERFLQRGLGAIVGVESRGFIFAAALASKMKTSFVPVRKPGKLPAQVDRESYSLEYGTDVVEMHKDSIVPGSNVLIVDDVIATGGTAGAAIRLAERQGGKVVGCAFAIELSQLGGRAKLPDALDIYSVLTY